MANKPVGVAVTDQLRASASRETVENNAGWSDTFRTHQNEECCLGGIKLVRTAGRKSAMLAGVFADYGVSARPNETGQISMVRRGSSVRVR